MQIQSGTSKYRVLQCWRGAKKNHKSQRGINVTHPTLEARFKFLNYFDQGGSQVGWCCIDSAIYWHTLKHAAFDPKIWAEEPMLYSIRRSEEPRLYSSHRSEELIMFDPKVWDSEVTGLSPSYCWCRQLITHRIVNTTCALIAYRKKSMCIRWRGLAMYVR